MTNLHNQPFDIRYIDLSPLFLDALAELLGPHHGQVQSAGLSLADRSFCTIWTAISNAARSCRAECCFKHLQGTHWVVHSSKLSRYSENIPNLSRSEIRVRQNLVYCLRLPAIHRFVCVKPTEREDLVRFLPVGVAHPAVPADVVLELFGTVALQDLARPPGRSIRVKHLNMRQYNILNTYSFEKTQHMTNIRI